MDYQGLYRLQDKILTMVFSKEHDFYLTGGTALHRFYYDGRYSDDLDFFVSDSVQFGEDVYEVIESIKSANIDIRFELQTRDFYRVLVDDMLQVDFVNDRVYRYGKSKIINGFRIDNKINILANKVSAIVGRDEEKDIFDLFFLAYNESFKWKELLEIVNKKTFIEKDIFIYRVKNFPLSWLERIKCLNSITISKEDVDLLCDDVLYERDNSLNKDV